MSDESRMSCAGTVSLTYHNREEAISILGAVDVDNKGYVTADRRGNQLVFECESDNPGMLRNTLDDLLSCIAIAEKMVRMR